MTRCCHELADGDQGIGNVRSPRDALTALQTSRLKHTLELAYANVPHCRKKFFGAGVSPDDFKSLSDIVRFPFTLKNDAR